MNTSDWTKTSSESDIFPMSGLKASTIYKNSLTKYEQVEVQKYDHVFYLGQKVWEYKIEAPCPGDLKERPHSASSAKKSPQKSAMQKIAE